MCPSRRSKLAVRIFCPAIGSEAREDLSNIDGIGPNLARDLIVFFNDTINAQLLDDFENLITI